MSDNVQLLVNTNAQLTQLLADATATTRSYGRKIDKLATEVAGKEAELNFLSESLERKEAALAAEQANSRSLWAESVEIKAEVKRLESLVDSLKESVASGEDEIDALLDELEAAASPGPQPTREFKAGDRVRVLPDPQYVNSSGNLLDSILWPGRTGIVRDAKPPSAVTDDGVRNLTLDGWLIAETSLELVR